MSLQEDNQKGKLICIRADANETIASGHVMRCMAIAKAIEQQGGRVLFLLSDDNPRNLIESRGFSCVSLHSEWKEKEKELDTLIHILKDLQADMLLIDSYQITERYLKILKDVLTLAYLDDMDMFSYPVDILIRYGFFMNEDEYRKKYEGTSTLLLTGTPYIPLRSEFVSLIEKKEERLNVLESVQSENQDNTKKLLITTGASDPYNIAGNLIDKLSVHPIFKDWELDVICGPFNVHSDELKMQVKTMERVYIHENVRNMAEWMKVCDVAVTAGGSTVYELCAMGVPFIVFTFAQNQVEGVKTATEYRVCDYAGDASKNTRQTIENIISYLELLIKDDGERERRIASMQSLIDGSGAWRIASKLLLFPKR